MLRQLSTPQTSGRISGFGSGLGYFGSVMLLLIVYVGFISGDGDTRGLLGYPVGRRPERAGRDAVDRRLVRAVRAAAAHHGALAAARPAPTRERASVFIGAYRRLWDEVVGEWRRDRNVVYYLFASAVFRDGLDRGVRLRRGAGRQRLRRSRAADVLLFGVSASVVAALGAVLGGRRRRPVRIQAGHRRLAGGDDRGRA